MRAVSATTPASKGGPDGGMISNDTRGRDPADHLHRHDDAFPNPSGS